MKRKLLKSKLVMCLISWLVIFTAVNPIVLAQPPHQQGMEESKRNFEQLVRDWLAKLVAFVESMGVNIRRLLEKIKKIIAGFFGNFDEILEKIKNFLRHIFQKFRELVKYVMEKLKGFFEWQFRIIKEQFESIEF